jgi:translation elongation factor EF-1alpha
MENIEKEPDNLVNKSNFTEKIHAEEIIESIEDNYLDLYIGDGSDTHIFNKSIRNTKPLCILIAGLTNSGKTTFISTIYELFQTNEFTNIYFAGSLTLPAWEKRCHLSRVASMRETPDTERTKILEESIFHLDVSQDNYNYCKSMFFIDIAGERYRLAKDSIDECKILPYLSRSDFIVVLIDGEKLINHSDRNIAYIDNRTLIRSFIDSDMIGNNSYVQVVVTKMDLINNHKDKEEINNYINEIQKNIHNEFRDKLGKLEFINIAARPINNILPFGYNIESIFTKWLENEPTLKCYTRKSIDVIRSFDKYRPS